MFLGLPNCGILLIIRLKSRTEKNSTYVQASRTESTYKDMKLTMNFRSSTLVYTPAPLLSKLNGKAPYRRGKRGLGKKKKEVVKVNSGAVKKKRK